MRMKYLQWLLTPLLIIGLAVFPVQTQAQSTVTLQAATPGSVTFSISNPSCTSVNQCVHNIYRIVGACPTTLVGSTGWTLVGTTAVNATSFTDTTVSPSTQYSYDEEASPAGATSSFAGPSNCVSVTTPFHPTPSVLGTPSAN